MRWAEAVFLPEGYDEDEVPQQRSELTIEEPEKQAIKPSAVGLAALATNSHGHDSDASTPDESDDEAVPPRPPPISNSTSTSTPKSKPSKKKTPKPTPAPQNPSTTRNRGNRPPPPHNSDEEASSAPMPTPPTQNPARTAPKRTAARKSESAVKSHYFEHDSAGDEDEGNSSARDEDPESADAVVVGKPVGKRGRPAGLGKKGRRGRGRGRGSA